jgi:hypothetical protein
MFTRKTKTELARLRIEEEEYARRVRLGEGQEVAEPTASAPCERHSDWRPARGIDTQPRQASEACPHCQREMLKRRQPDPTVADPIVLENARSRSPFDFGRDSERVAQAIEKYDERQRTRPGHVVPGSVEERRALDLIQDRRDEERDANRRRSGRVVIERIEGGDVIQYLAPSHGRGLIRRGP